MEYASSSTNNEYHKNKSDTFLSGFHLIINTPAYKFLFFLLHVIPGVETEAPTAG